MILLVGATGRLGGVLVDGLVRDGVPVRALTRSTDAAARLRAMGVGCAVGDLRNASDVARAVAGCTVVVSAASGFGPMGSSTPKSVDRDGNLNLIRAAAAAGVRHFILVSMHGAAPDARLPLLRMKHDAEQALRASGLGWTIIRPTACLETYLDVVGGPIERRRSTIVFGAGNVPVNFVSVKDVAALVRRAIDDRTLRGRLIDWGGADLTLNELSSAVHATAGTDGKTTRIPLPALRVMAVVARPFSPFLARMAQASVIMNTTDMTFDAAPEREAVGGLPWTGMEEALAGR
ncbi:SDR family oxidoreductase [Glaciibacter superstes]|uniref:SDR family oxidoreductase n=1 Tax=Glaciibacter superstes TaxID=501023 RepID=UPI0003B6B502|nr:SDR family oxidoreductase [Glaciibacter superstes]